MNRDGFLSAKLSATLSLPLVICGPIILICIQRSSVEENKTVDLSINSQSVRCRLLFRGPKKYVNEIYKKYDEQLRSGRKPDRLHVTYIKADRKQKFCDDIKFLSKKMPSNSQTSALKLGATPTVKTITKSSKAVTVPLPEELTPEVFLLNLKISNLRHCFTDCFLVFSRTIKKKPKNCHLVQS